MPVIAYEPLKIQFLDGPCDGAFCIFVGALPEMQLKGLPVYNRKTKQVETVSHTWYELRFRETDSGVWAEDEEEVLDSDAEYEPFYVAT